MAGKNLDHPEWKVPCGATSANGRPCRSYAIRGGTVCRMHGGASPEVRRKAEERLFDARLQMVGLLPDAMRRLEEMLDSSNDSVALRAVCEVLDRAGFAAVRHGHVTVTIDDSEIDAEIETLLHVVPDPPPAPVEANSG